ncbi:MAG: hypothetical protein MRY83_06975 [Flavobacteriales bacterium]|nr:hypothetical protein [Flavobacteriales bacterium]
MVCLKKHIKHIARICLFLGLVLIQNCSTKVNKFPNRAYHNVTTRYNIYFNGLESYKEGRTKIKESHQEDYTQILPIFIYGDEQASKSVFTEMNRTIEKCSKGIQRHSMFIKKKEYNKWIDDSYLLMAKAHFQKRDYELGLEIMDYLMKTYKNQEMGYLAQLWMVRTFIEREQFDKADRILTRLSGEKKFPETLIKEYSLVYADFYLKQKNYNLVISELKTAIENTKKRKERVRYNFILAQLYQELGNFGMASEYYKEVLNLNPAYEMEFYAKVNSAIAFDSKSGNSEEIREQLMKLLKDEKNAEFKDQIYYALGELDLNQGKMASGIGYLKKAAAVSTKNPPQKARIYLRLANLYYEESDYRNAQAYFDSCTTVMSPKHEEYTKVIGRRNSLTRLVRNIKIIEKEDSLQRIAGLSNKEKKKLVDKIIDDVIAAEEKEKAKANVATSTTGNNTQTGGWYFNNPNTLSFGIQEFKKIWGERVLEDDWRRKNKSLAEFVNPEDLVLEKLEEDTASIDEKKKPDFYLNQIPDSPEDLNASHNRKIDAMFDLGILYYEQFEEPYSAIETFKELISLYDTCRHIPATYYHLYKVYNLEGNTAEADNWKNRLIKEFPDSEYAKVLSNPEYFKEKLSQSKHAENYYKEAYNLYVQKRYSDVKTQCEQSEKLYPDNSYAAKFLFLSALCVGKLNGKTALINALKEVTKKYPKTEEGAEALTLIEQLSKSKSVSDTPPKTNKVKYKFSPNTKHDCILVVPTENTDLEDIKNRIVDFNKQFYASTNLKVNMILLNDNLQMIFIKKFDSKDKAMDYHTVFETNTTHLKNINDKNYSFFAISYDNLAEFYKNKDIGGYLDYFKEKYLK